MKVLLDTNIVIDYFLNREPFSNDAMRILQGSTDAVYDAFVTSNAITDIYYVLRKQITAAEARNAIRNLLVLLQVAPVEGYDCRGAVDSPISDFEDALMVICAKRQGIDHIVTRDTELLRECKFAIASADFLKLFQHG